MPGHVGILFKVKTLLNQRSYNIYDDNSVNPIAPGQFTGTVSYNF